MVIFHSFLYVYQRVVHIAIIMFFTIWRFGGVLFVTGCVPQCISQDWGSMIGEITLGEAEFFSDLWRTATDPNWGKDPGLNLDLMGLKEIFHGILSDFNGICI